MVQIGHEIYTIAFEGLSVTKLSFDSHGKVEVEELSALDATRIECQAVAFKDDWIYVTGGQT